MSKAEVKKYIKSLERDAVKGESTLLKPTNKKQQSGGAGNDAAPGAK